MSLNHDRKSQNHTSKIVKKIKYLKNLQHKNNSLPSIAVKIGEVKRRGKVK